jgi:pimeloyl-ACP methyl ester carboxylesterase
MTPPKPRETSCRTAFLLPLWLLLGIHLAGPAPATEAVRIVLPEEVAASDRFTWSFPVRVVNGMETGLYTDSLICTVEDLDPGRTRAGRTQRLVLNPSIRSLKAVSRLDSAVARYQGLALAERARMTFLLKGHDADGHSIEARASVEIQPGSVSRRFPSRFLGGRDSIEYVLVPEVWPKGPSPGVLLVHGEGSHARQLLPLAWDLSNLGYAVMLASLPGYGLSSGEPDFAGPATVRALGRALQHLRRTPGVDSTRIALWGISRGATAAALLAADRKDLLGLVLQSGLYDLPSAFAATSSEELRAAILREAGKSRREWRRRSPARAAGRLPSPILLVHGERDSIAPPAQAADMASALGSTGKSVTLEMVPGADHSIPAAVVVQPVLAFLRERLRPSK